MKDHCPHVGASSRLAALIGNRPAIECRKKGFAENAFSLIELLVVIAIIAVLAALSILGYSRWVERAQIAAVQSGDMRNLILAINLYRADNNMAWPGLLEKWEDGADLPRKEHLQWFADQDSKDVVVKVRDYLKDVKVQDDGTFKDPWGNQYCMKWDLDGSGRVEYWSPYNDSSDPTKRENVKETVIVVSLGKNKTMDDPKVSTCDDVFSFCPYKDKSMFLQAPQ